MKKHKFDLNKFYDIYVKKMAPTYEFYVFAICFFLYALLTDLCSAFNFELKFTLKILDIVGTFNLIYCGVWFICFIFYKIMYMINVKRYQKDHPTGEEHLPYED